MTKANIVVPAPRAIRMIFCEDIASRVMDSKLPPLMSFVTLSNCASGQLLRIWLSDAIMPDFENGLTMKEADFVPEPSCNNSIVGAEFALIFSMIHQLAIGLATASWWC